MIQDDSKVEIQLSYLDIFLFFTNISKTLSFKGREHKHSGGGT